MSKRVCPSCPDNETFITSAHIVEYWLVDSEGNWIETVGPGDVAASPSHGNIWECATCGNDETMEEK